MIPLAHFHLGCVQAQLRFDLASNVVVECSGRNDVVKTATPTHQEVAKVEIVRQASGSQIKTLRGYSHRDAFDRHRAIGGNLQASDWRRSWYRLICRLLEGRFTQRH